jgi:hypothetical protein
MAVTVTDSVIAHGSSTATVETGNLTVASGDRLLVFVGNSDGTPQAVSAVKWGGSAGTNLSQSHDTGVVQSFLRGEAWLLTNPTAQTSTVHVTLAASVTQASVIAVSLAGASATLGTIAAANGNGVGAAASVAVGSATGDLVVDFLYRLALSQNVGAGQTQLEQSGGVEAVAASSTEAGAASVTMSWTDGGGGTVSNWEWLMIGVPVAVAGGGGATLRKNSLMRLGVER